MQNSIPSVKDKIMVIDDSQEDLVLLERILTRRSFDVCTFTCGKEALKFAKESAPDLIFLDINMPDMDGYEVCKLFQQDIRLRAIPIIFLSARNTTEDKVRGFEVGGVDFISKPFQFEEVHARVNTHLRIHYLLKRQLKELENNYIHLRKLESLRDTLVHMIIHDMRSPLSVLSGFLRLIKRDLNQGSITDKTKSYIDDVIVSADSLTEMMSSTLDVSKMEAGKIELNITEFDLVPIVHDVMKRIYLPESSVRLEALIPEKTVMMKGDKSFVDRIIQNLISNSLKFAPKSNGLVKLSVEVNPESILVKVEDNGPGVPASEKDNLFDKFWTGNAKKQGHRYSVGLGLTFCKMAVEAHHGQIGVDVPDSSEGIIFWFKLPR